MTLYLGFSGRARHGKTTACEAIVKHVEKNGGTAKLYDIGNMVRRYCIAKGLLPEVARKDMTKEQLAVLVKTGNERRALDENYWVKQMACAIEQDNPDVALCPNMRFPQEAKSFKDKAGFIVRCTRLNENGSLFISQDRDPNDITETALDSWSADFYLTAKTGQDEFVELQAVSLYTFLKAKSEQQHFNHAYEG